MAHDAPPETLPAHMPPGDEANYKRLSGNLPAIRQVLVLAKAGVRQATIAQQFGCHQSTISRIVSTLTEDTTALAVDVAKADAFDRTLALRKRRRKLDKVGLDSSKQLDRIAGIGQSVDSKGDVGNQVLIQIGLAQAPQVTAAGAKVVSIISPGSAQLPEVQGE
jgi:hypothetical protein